MKTVCLWPLIGLGSGLALIAACAREPVTAVTVPISLDHNRMLVDAEIQRPDGSWRALKLWVDTGNPDFFLSVALARDLGIDLDQEVQPAQGARQPLPVPPPAGVRIGGMSLDFSDVSAQVLFAPQWLFATMHIDANLPATVLHRYRVVFDYPRRQLSIAAPGGRAPRGKRAAASIHPRTGIVQIEAQIDGDSLSLALDNGASYSFLSAEVLARLAERHPDWPRRAGALGCANIWGWWPGESAWQVLRVPEIRWDTVFLTEVGLVGLPGFFPDAPTLGAWYSKKTARPVQGFLGPNAFQAYRIEIDYQNGAVYFEKGAEADPHDMDLVGLTIRLLEDGRYQVIGVADVEGVAPGDLLLEIDGLVATGATMGAVVDALRGEPGDRRVLLMEREGGQFRVDAQVSRGL